MVHPGPHRTRARGIRARNITLIALLTAPSLLVVEHFVWPWSAGARARDPRRPRVVGPRPGGRPPRGAHSGSTGFGRLPGEKAFNECRRIPGHRRTKITLKPDSELHDLVAWISGMTCKRFIVTGSIRAPKVTLVSPTPITATEAYRAFLSTLNAMGLTVQPAGRFLKIVEIAGAPPRPIPTCVPGQRCPRDERAVTQIIQLTHVEPDDVAAVLKSLTKGSIITYGPTNLLILTDTGANVSRLRRVIRELDRPAPAEKMWFLKIRHAVASDVAELVRKVIPVADGTAASGQRRTTPRRRQARRRRQAARRKSTVITVQGGRSASVSRIIADDRTNALIIVADERGYLQVSALVRRVAVPQAGGEGRLHLIKLANADAEELAATLTGVTGGSGSRRTSRRGANRRTSRKSNSAKGGTALFSEDVKVTAHKAGNALLIVANMRDYLTLQRIIQKMDQPRRQVFIEATILEVSLTKQRDLGVSYHVGQQVGSGSNQSTLILGNNATNTVSPSSTLLDPAAMMGMAAGLYGPELTNAGTLLGQVGISVPSFGVFFQALQNNDAVNLISSPHILATDNEESEISVGENVPFQSGLTGLPSLGTTTTASSYMQSIQRQDVALTLKITPHVNDGGMVRLDIDQELQEVKSIDTTLGPTTTKRKVKTMVTVRDQQTVVIGGLITNKVKQSENKVPILGDIPILGYLFKTTSKIVEKTNLLIFLTPYVVQDQSDLRRILQRKIRQRREFIERYTAFKDVDLDAVIDYGHKRGLVAEIHRVAGQAEAQARLERRAARLADQGVAEGRVRADPRDLALAREGSGSPRKQSPSARPRLKPRPGREK